MRFFHRHDDKWFGKPEDPEEEKKLDESQKKDYKKKWSTYKVNYEWDKDIINVWPRYFTQPSTMTDYIQRQYDHGELTELDAQRCWEKLKQYNGGSGGSNDEQKDNSDEDQYDEILAISDLEIFDKVFDLYKCDAQFFQWDNAVKRQLDPSKVSSNDNDNE